MNTKTRQGTRAVWAGEEEYLLGATQVPVVLSAAFGYKDMDEWLEVARGKAEGHIYTRNSNPTIHVFEEKVRLLEDAEAATSAASGMGIISSTLFALLASGNRVVSVKDTYGGTSALFNEYMPKYRIDTVQCDTAESHPAVERVFYPGLESHAGHAIARQQMRGFGGILSFLLKENSLDAVGRFIPHLRFAHAAGNLGAVETIVAPPATSSHVECTPEERARLGIPEGLIRYSTGIEDVEDLIDDLASALIGF